MRLLCLAPWFPSPSGNGSKIRLYHLLKALSGRHAVTLLSFLRPGEPADPGELAGLCRSIHTVPWRGFAPGNPRSLLACFSPYPRSIVACYQPDFARLLQRLVAHERPDLIIASELATAGYAFPVTGLLGLIDDLEIGLLRQNWSYSSTLLSNLRRSLNWAKVGHYLRQLLRRFSAATVVSTPELDLVLQVAPAYGPIFLVPNGVDLAHFTPGLAPPRPNTLVYHGSLTFSANYDAIHYFLSEILPLIHARLPDVSLQITGSHDGLDSSALPLDERVTLTGFLPDVRPAVAGAWACVVPLRFGGGTRLKILEAMAMGTPVVSTSKGAEGLAVIPGRDLLIADSPSEFARQAIRLLTDPALRAALAANGRRLVEGNYGWAAIGDLFCQAVESVLKLSSSCG